MGNTDLLQNGAVSAEQEQAVSGDDLFQAYQEGKSFEELQEMFAHGSREAMQDESDLQNEGEDERESASFVEQAETKQEEATDSEEPKTGDSTTDTGEKPEEPFRVYQTKEDFQKHFNHEWNKRYASMQSKMSEQEKRLEETSGLLAEVLGVPKERAMEELRSRRYAMEAEQNGYENPAQYAALKQAENQIAEMKRAEQTRQLNEQIADIRRQGEALSQKASGFDLDRAMENEMFRQTVFTLQRAGATDSVERAFKAVYFENFMKQSEQPKKETVQRPKEGAAAPKTKADVKPANVAGFSSSKIRDLERRILNGERVEL